MFSAALSGLTLPRAGDTVGTTRHLLTSPHPRSGDRSGISVSTRILGRRPSLLL